jgi:hypothetical protein
MRSRIFSRETNLFDPQSQQTSKIIANGVNQDSSFSPLKLYEDSAFFGEEGFIVCVWDQTRV